jgi:hypothetical protein
VLRPEMAILIRCAHVYVGFAMNTQPLPRATVRLQELVQMRELLALPSFDPAHFRLLLTRFGAGLVVDFARHLFHRLLDEDPFDAVLGRSASRSAFPLNLWWDGSAAGFPVVMDWDPHELILRSAGLPDLADLLGPAEVRLGADGRVRVSFLGADDTLEAGRYVMHRIGGGIGGGILLDCSASDHALRLRMSLPPVADNHMAAWGVQAGTFRYELFYRPGAGEHDFSDYSSTPAGPDDAPRVVACERDGGHTEMVLDLPWASLGRLGMPSAGEGLPLTIRARVQERPWGVVAGGVVAPLRLVR